MNEQQTGGPSDPMPVIIEEPVGIARPAEPILGGIPVPRGEIRGGGWFSLSRENGDASFILEGTPAAYWPDGSVKWLHLWGNVDLQAGQVNRFHLRRATAVETAQQEALRVDPDPGQEDADAPQRIVCLRGGELDVDLAADTNELLRVGDAGQALQTVVAPGLSFELRLVNPERTRRRHAEFELEGSQPEPIVQQNARRVYRLSGRFLDDAAREVMQLRLFIEVRRDTPQIMLQPVMIYTGIPDEDLIESLTVTVHTRYRGDGCRYGFGQDRDCGYWDVMRPVAGGPRWPMARQIQLGSSFYRTDKRVTTEGSWVKATEGQHAAGWCHLGDEAGGVTAAMRYYWQEYPRGLSVDADAGTIRFHLYPDAAEPLDLRRYSPTRYGRAMYETGMGPYPKRTHGATGIGKSSELMLHFHDADALDKARVAHHALTFTRPCRIQAPPKQFAESRALGTLVDAESSPQPEIERTTERMMEFMMAEREYRGWYGLMDFGDLIMSYYNDQGQDRWAFDDGGYAWLNDEHIPSYGLWLNALRRVNARWLEFAIAMSRHNRDVDSYHLGPIFGSGTRHNVNHWGGYDKEWRVVMPMGRRLHYYITADPWTAESIRNIAHKHREFTRAANTAPSTTAALAGQLALWEMSGDEEDAKIVRNLADTFAALVRPDGRWSLMVEYDMSTGIGRPADDQPQPDRYFFMNVFGGQHVLVELAELLNHAPLKEALRRHADFVVDQLESEGEGRGLDRCIFLAHAYHMTGDEKYRRPIQEAMENHFAFEPIELGGDGPLDEPRHLSAGTNWSRRNKMLCSPFGDMPLLVPYAATVLE